MSTAALPSSHIPESFCPECGYRMDATAAADDLNLMPQPGDASICISCGQLLVFDEGMTMRKATREDIAAMMGNQQNWSTIERAQAFIRRRGRVTRPPSAGSRKA